MARRPLAILAAAAACAALAAPAAAQEPQTSLPDIEDEVMCPVCGFTLELASEAPQANQMRDFIRDRIDRGQSKEEIKDALVAEFGPEVLAIPEAEGFDLAAWLVPGVAIVLAGVAIFVGLRRWRRAGGGGQGGPPPGEALDADEAERLDSDLARYEL
jgi:cytochrome c-type biogenesis protein CcmH/NrfF